ncbi:MAG TPA: tetratricopeptide repeat protein [Blastocatellia bacterium]|nr:tetratricopeptide repeat protein [Blastocatellia bacterium]
MKSRRRFPAVICILFTLSLHSLALGQSAAAQQPKDAEQYHRAGVGYYDSGEYEKAIEAYRQALQLNPDSTDAWYHLGMAYSSLGRYKEAVEAYSRAIRRKPDYAAAHFNLGHAYSNLKQYDNAIKAFQQAIQYEPDNLEAYFALGYAYFDSGRDEKAAATFEEAIRRKPDNPYAYFNLGLLYFPGGPHARAVDAFTQAILRDPRYAEAYYHRALAYLYMGRGDSAAGDAEIYLSLRGWRADYSLPMAIVAYFGHLQARREAEARRILADAARQSDPSEWPRPVIEYLLREISAKELFESAPDGAKKVEARAYIGLDLSMQGDKKAALEHLRWVMEHSGSGSLTFALAISEMERIKASSAVSFRR